MTMNTTTPKPWPGDRIHARTSGHAGTAPARRAKKITSKMKPSVIEESGTPTLATAWFDHDGVLTHRRNPSDHSDHPGSRK